VVLGGSETGLSPACQQTSPALLKHLDMPDADIIIQSCDLVNFRVHKSALSLSSPIFGDMLSLPQPLDDDAIDGLPVVRLSENAEVLNSLLTLLYPIPSAIPISYDNSLRLLVASKKYDMVGVQSRIRAEIQSRKFPTPTGAATFRAYAIASSGGLSSERETSARLTLDSPMTFEDLSDELPFFEGWALCDLIGFRKRCRDNLISCFELFLNLQDPPFNIWMSCRSSPSTYSNSDNTGCSPSWLISIFKQHLTDLDQAFTKPLPNPSNIREEYLSALQAHITSSSCISCTRVHTLKGDEFCKELETRLLQAISQVGDSFIFGRIVSV
jgi:hypothetical protein